MFIGIDLDRDGTIDMVHKNHELFEATSVIRINDKNYRVSEISRDGRKVTFEQVNEDAQNRPLLKKGSATPLFETQRRTRKELFTERLSRKSHHCSRDFKDTA